MKNHLILALLMLSTCLFGADPTKTIHRTGVDAPKTLGWIQASSTDGNFTVDLPFPYTDMTIRDNDQHFYLCSILSFKETESYFVVVSKGVYENQSAAKFKAEKYISDTKRLGGKLTMTTIGGKTAYEFVFQRNGSINIQLFVPLKLSSIMIAMESAPSQLQTNTEKYIHIKNSLSFSDPSKSN